MSIKENCFKMVNGVDEVINMACNMGGMGFIENNKALCMLSVLVLYSFIDGMQRI